MQDISSANIWKICRPLDFLRHFLGLRGGLQHNTSFSLKLVIDARFELPSKFIGITLPETNKFLLKKLDGTGRGSGFLLGQFGPIFRFYVIMLVSGRVTWTNTENNEEVAGVSPAFGRFFLPKTLDHQQVVELIHPVTQNARIFSWRKLV